MTPGINAYSGTSASENQSSTSSTSKTTAASDKNMFMQLMVAQLRNQDPLNPSALRNQVQFMIQVSALATVYMRNH